MENKKRLKKKIKNNYFEETDFLKDCPDYEFIPTILPATKRIIVIGDVHGDFSLVIKTFMLADLIDKDYNWIANPPSTVVVQVGDQIDSCRPITNVYDCHNENKSNDKKEDLKILEFFNQMNEKAKKRGGAVYNLFGNHELMNAKGNFRYVSYQNYYNFDYYDKKN